MNNHLATQMYTLRSLTLLLPQVLAAVADAGYSGIETFGPLQPAAADLKAQLDAQGLRCVSAHVGLDTLESELDAVAEYHRTLGNDVLVAPWLAPEQRPSDVPGWQALGRRLDALGERCRRLGMRLLYHNHDFEMVILDGRHAIEWMADAASPENLGLEFDAGWVVAGGGDPLALLEEYAGRCPRLHAKETFAAHVPVAEQEAGDVGEGLVAWNEVLEAARKAGVEWVVAEHDSPADPLLSIQRSATYLLPKWR